MINAAKSTGGEYTITVTGFPVFPADKSLTLAHWPDNHGNTDKFRWTIKVKSKRGYLQARSNPGIDPIWLYVYEVSIDAAGKQSRRAVDLDGQGNPQVSLGTQVLEHTIIARINPDFIIYYPGIYNNLRLALSPVTNVLV